MSKKRRKTQLPGTKRARLSPYHNFLDLLECYPPHQQKQQALRKHIKKMSARGLRSLVVKLAMSAAEDSYRQQLIMHAASVLEVAQWGIARDLDYAVEQVVGLQVQRSEFIRMMRDE